VAGVEVSLLSDELLLVEEELLESEPEDEPRESVL
jgi:hypothetical protein